jgi:hypothetical protein
MGQLLIFTLSLHQPSRSLRGLYAVSGIPFMVVTDSIESPRRTVMQDFLYLLTAIGFFVAAGVYYIFCNKL